MTATIGAYEAALRTGGELLVRRLGGQRRTTLDVARFVAPADAVDLSLLRACDGPVLDIGCGPGRMLAALQVRGHVALGVDIAKEAVRQSRARGTLALRRDVFDPLPGEGLWGTALLLDGNVGIGGDPVRLLRRVRSLLTPTGRAIVETDPDSARDRRDRMVFVDGAGRQLGEPFGWARIGVDALRRLAPDSGFAVVDTRTGGGRTFAVLDACVDSAPASLSVATYDAVADTA